MDPGERRPPALAGAVPPPAWWPAAGRCGAAPTSVGRGGLVRVGGGVEAIHVLLINRLKLTNVLSLNEFLSGNFCDDQKKDTCAPE